MLGLLDRNFCAAFDAASLEYGASSLCRNACAKTMRLCTVSSVWLVRSFWHISVIIPDFTFESNISLKYRQICIIVILSYPHLHMVYPQFNRGSSVLWISRTPISPMTLYRKSTTPRWLWKTITLLYTGGKEVQTTRGNHCA